MSSRRRTPAAALRLQQQQATEEEALSVRGYACRFVEDDGTAAHMQSNAFLVAWNGDETLKIDRFDVRHLLDDLRTVRGPKKRPTEFSNLSNFTDFAHGDEEIDRERYCDLMEREGDGAGEGEAGEGFLGGSFSVEFWSRPFMACHAWHRVADITPLPREVPGFGC